MKRAALFTAVVVAAAVSATAARAAVRSFHSPTGNIECEVAATDVRGTYAYCQTFRSPKSIRLAASGRMKVCTGTRCLGNGPEDAFTLRYGRSVDLGPFRCTSRTTGMRCVVRRSGHGFLISRDRLVRF